MVIAAILGEIMKLPENIELLTAEEYADRFRVCRTTIFEWKKQGKLIPGRHFIMVGRVLRFLWSIDVIRDLHNVNGKTPEKSHVHLKAKGKTRLEFNNKSTINLEY